MRKMTTVIIVIISILIIGVIFYFLLIGGIDKSEPKIVTLDKPIKFIGLGINTSNKAIYKDVKIVSNEYYSIKKKNPIPNKQEPWIFVAVSRNYNKETGIFEYIVGDVVTKIDSIPTGLQSYEIPSLTYAIFPIRPKSSIAWGITIGRMKRYIYTEWMPKSGYEPAGIIDDFELHDDRSLGKHPEISLYVAIKKK